MTSILALDIGTSSVRAGLYLPNAEVLPETMVKQKRQLSATRDGGFEIDAELAFEQVVSAIDELYERCGSKASTAVHGVISSFWHSLMGVDEDGNPTTPLYAWAETRPAEFVAELKRDLDQREVHNRTGCPFHSSYWPAKLIWIRRTNPDAFERTHKWLSFPDFLGQRLFGNDATSVSMASGTGIFDIRTQDWDTELLDYLNVKSDELPSLDGGSEASLRFVSAFKERWPNISEVSWFPAIGDGAANNIGAGCFEKDKAALMIGTSGAMRVVYKGDPPTNIPVGLWCYLVDSERVAIGGALSDGGGLYRWLKDNFKIAEDDDLTELEMSKRAPAGHGITFLPFVAGERSTGYNADATGAIIGLRNAHDSVDIVQAALESVAYRFEDIYTRLHSVLPIESIIASGGALRASPIWTQIICDVIGVDMSLPYTREASSRGAVLLGAEKSGLIGSIDEAPKPNTKGFESRKEVQAQYKDAMKTHQDMYRMLIVGGNK